MTAAAAKVKRLPPLPSLRDLIGIYKLTAMRQLAQNFLLDMNITRKFVRTVGDLSEVHVCEVGPGPGGITRALLESDLKRLVVVEKDRRFLPSLKLLASASNDRMDIVHGDILYTDVSEYFPTELKREWSDDPPPLRVVGNLPFNVSTPLIIRWFETMSERTGPFAFGRTPLLLTFQKEVAERLVAPILGEQRCRLSATAEYLADVKIMFTIPGCAFVPAPDVDCAVVRIVPKVEPLIRLPFQLVQKVNRHLFHFRRKYAHHGIDSLFPKTLAKPLSDEIFRRTRISPKVQCTQISVEEIRDMCIAYDEICRRIPGLYHYFYRKPVALEVLAELENPFPPKFKFAEERSEGEQLSGNTKSSVSFQNSNLLGYDLKQDGVTLGRGKRHKQ